MKTKKKVIITLILVVLIAAAAGFAYMYFFTDMFKTPEEMFYKYLEKASKDESRYSYQDALKELKDNQTKSYKSNSTAQIEMKTKGTDYASRINQVTYDEISKLKLKLETQNIPIENKSETKIIAEHNDEQVTEISLVKDADKFGIKSEFLDDKYIVVENQNLKSLMRKLGQESANIPDQIEMVDVYDLLYIDEKDQDRIINNYKDVIKDSISADKYKKVDNVIQNVNGQDLKTTVYALSLSEKDYNNFTIKLLEKLEQDDTTLNLVLDKLTKILSINIFTANRFEGNEELTIESLKKVLEAKIEELKTKYVSETSTIEIVLYAANDNLARIEFKKYNEIESAIDLYNVEDKKHIDVFQKDAYGGLEKTCALEYKTTDNETDGSITMIKGYQEVKLGFNAKKENDKREYKITIDTENLTIALTMDSQIEYTENLKVDTLDSKNSIVLNNMDKERLDQLFTRIGDRFQRTLITKMVELRLIDANTLSALNY